MKKHNPKFLALVEKAKTEIQEITIAEVRQLLQQKDEFYLIDVREENEWKKGHLPKSLHLCKGILERDIESYISEEDGEIILYCGGGYRSALSAQNLVTMGYSRVFSMQGGYKAWKEADYSIVKDESLNE